MSDNEFHINPQNLKRNYRGSDRPLPPGQTRHVYDDEEDTDIRYNDEYVDDDENDDILRDDDAEPVKPKRQKKSQPKKQKTAPAKSRQRSSEEKAPRWVDVLMDRRVAIWLGLFCLLLGVGIFILLLSYLKTGALDQALILNLSPEEIVEAGLTVNSGVGAVGAWFGHILFAESFGIGAFVFAAYFTIVGWKLLFARKFNFWALTFRCILLAISVSIVLGLITYAVSSHTFWGGVHGHYVNKWLLTMTGVPGALLVTLLLVGTVIILYLNELKRAIARWKEASARRREARLKRQEETRIQRHAQEEQPKADEVTEPERKTAADQEPEVKVPQKEVAAVKSPDTVFEIDTITPAQEPTKTESTQSNVSKSESTDPEFKIDVPNADLGKKTGSVAERLVAEQGEYDPRAELSRFKFPTLELLKDYPVKATFDTEEQQANKDRIIRTLGSYNITIESIKATVGPTVTLYEIVPKDGIRIAQIKRLEADIALSLAAKGIRIIAPMPGKGTVGIEVPNREPQIVSMRSILSSKKFRESKAKLPVALGATIANEIFVTDLASMPHALVAGATGQGKSVGLNVIISSLLFRKHPTELKFVLIDPKMVEFSVYERLKGHYLASLPGEEDAIVTDPSKVLNVLNSLCVEMDNRYALLRNAGVNQIEDYNEIFCQRRLSIEKGHKYLPYIVVIIDEFADLIMTGGKEIEMPVMRITQKARAVGIHMIIATQRPSTNVLTGLIKANCPSRIAFRVNQNVDSRTILDRPGAEQLIGRGDMLYSQNGDMERMQCAFVSSNEIKEICNSIDIQPGLERPYQLPEPVADNGGGAVGAGGLPAGGLDRDALFDEAARFVVLSSTASTSSLQRRFEIGYNRAGKIMDQMEAAGIVGPPSGAKPRSVLVDAMTLENILANR